MEQRNDSVRERLLAHLPQPESAAAYREQTAVLLAKHEKALSADRWAVHVLYLCVMGLLFFAVQWLWPHMAPGSPVGLRFLVGATAFAAVAALYDIRYRIYASQVAMLKEVKQVQLQILELQGALERGPGAGR